MAQQQYIDMAKPTLIEVFGTGATQNATSITILKSELPGLTASTSNTAESLVIGILLKAKISLTTTARDGDTTRSVAIEDGFDSIAVRGTTSYYQSQLSITAQKTNTVSTIDPDDY